MQGVRRVVLAVVLVGISGCGDLFAQKAPCGMSSTGVRLVNDVGAFGQGLAAAPRASIKPENLKWELPLSAATGVLIGVVDKPAADRIQSQSLQNLAGRWSNIGLGIELGAGGAAWAYGCERHHPYAAESGFKALEASGVALTVDLGLKLAFNRQYPYGHNSTGEFWEGGKSFPSGHAAMSFALASVMAHRYPHNHWIKWGSYALAAGVSLARYPAKKHFPSDILVGAPVGYLIGEYFSRPERD